MIKKDLEKLGAKFLNLNWNFKEEEINGKKEIVSYWSGDENEDIMVCVLKSNHFKEVFHRSFLARKTTSFQVVGERPT